MTIENTKKQIVLITGANRGIGLEVARQLGQSKWTVLLGCRSESRGAKAASTLQSEGIDAHAIKLDVANPSSISAAAARIATDFQWLDVLINNAAIHYDSWQDATHVDWDVVNEAIEVNTIAPWRLCIEFLPLLKRSQHPRIVNVSSEGGSLAKMAGTAPAYCLSKTGLNAVTRMLASLLKSDGILVNAICPGWTATDMGGEGGRPVKEGARGIVWAATLQDSGPTGGFYRDGESLNW